jgi:hypothetical protein
MPSLDPSRLRTICELILRIPDILGAVIDAQRFDSVDERPECTELTQE